MLSTDQIAEIVNTALEGVAKSKLGPVRRPPRGDEPNVREVIDNLAFQTFTIVLNNLFAKEKDGNDQR